jgi:hypothetical protein
MSGVHRNTDPWGSRLTTIVWRGVGFRQATNAAKVADRFVVERRLEWILAVQLCKPLAPDLLESFFVNESQQGRWTLLPGTDFEGGGLPL